MRTLTYITIALFASACGGLSDTGPLMAYELNGMWCNHTANPTCLIVDGNIQPAAYIWLVGPDPDYPSCVETGRLTGGLEFWPDTSSQLCLAPEYDIYSAAGEWTATGIRLEVDAATGAQRASAASSQPTITLKLDYQP